MNTAWILIALLIGLGIGANLVLSKFSFSFLDDPSDEISPKRKRLLKEILKVISTEAPEPSPAYTEPIHHSYSWKKNIRTFRDEYRCERTECIEAKWYPNKQWFFISYSNGFRNGIFWYIVKNARERMGKGQYEGDKNKLILASTVPFGDDEVSIEIPRWDWRIIQRAINAAGKSVESFNKNIPAASASPAH